METTEEPLTRSGRRHRLDHDPAPEHPVPLLLVRLLAVLALAGLAVLAVHAGAIFMCGLLVWCAAGMAWGWAGIVGLPVGWRVAVITLVTGLLVAAAVAVVHDAPRLRLVPVALAAGIVLTFLLQLIRSDGRGQLTTEVAATAAALSFIGLGAGLLGVAVRDTGPQVIAITMSSVAAAAVVDLGGSVVKDRAWLVPLAMLAGGLAGMGAAHVLGGLTWGVALLLGMFAGALSYAVRRVIEVQAGAVTLSGALASACASVLSVGALAEVVALVLAG